MSTSTSRARHLVDRHVVAAEANVERLKGRLDELDAERSETRKKLDIATGEFRALYRVLQDLNTAGPGR